MIPSRGPFREVFGVPEKTLIYCPLHSPLHSPLHIVVSFCNNLELVHESNVDKNGGKISDFRFLKKVLKLDFPKVYFFDPSKISLMPIPENPNFAAIF